MLRLRRLGIDTYQEPVLYMRRDCPVCRSEGFEAHSRVELSLGDRTIVATLNVVDGDFLLPQQAGLSEAAWRLLGASEGAEVKLRHPAPLESLGHVRAKVYGRRLTGEALHSIIGDVAAGRYSDLQLAAFVTACAGDRLDLQETVALTRAMVEAGERIDWGGAPVMDKHCVGGLPGNRTSMIVVPIVAACGLRMPKTSSRAITSPAGTADTMEVLAPVDLGLSAIRRVVEATGGCIVWGGSVRLSPADDVLIRVERPLDLDSQGQLVASILSKKVAAGASHVVLDMPVGPTAKVRSAAAAAALQVQLEQVGSAMGLQMRVLQTDGLAPVAEHRHEVRAARSGTVISIDNRRLARVAKLAGAPQSPCAGLDLHARCGEFVERGQALYTVHSESPGELAYAIEYAAMQATVVEVAEDA